MAAKTIGINMAAFFLFIFRAKTELASAGFVFPISYQLLVGLLLEVSALEVLV